MNTLSPSRVFFALWLSAQLWINVSSTSCIVSSSSPIDIMLTGAFVDPYLTVEPFVVVATSDGGALYACIHSNGLSTRVVKVDSAVKFQWYVELKASAGLTSYYYYPYAMVEDTTEGYIYVGGSVKCSSGLRPAVMFKINAKDGTMVKSAIYTKSTTSASYIRCLLIDGNDRSLIFGGYYENSGAFSPWAGTMDKSTLALTEKSVTSATVAMIYSVVQDGTSYVFAGSVGAAKNPWVAAVDSSGWTSVWEYSCSVCTTAVSSCKILLVSSGKYAVLASSVYYSVSSSTGISTSGVTFTSSAAMALATNSDLRLILGYDSTSNSFAYYYSVSNACAYDTGQIAKLSGISFQAADRLSTGDVVWVAGYVMSTYPRSFVARLEATTVLGCAAGQVNYLNKQCYTPMSTGCFGLCATCLIANDISACYTVTAAALTNGASLFMGRCATDGQNYKYDSAGSSACAQILINPSCHVLCGGECLVLADASKCLHHCKGSSLEPYIDNSDLAHNVCGCTGSRTFSTVSRRCVFTSGCYALCANGECGELASSAKCISCKSLSNMVSTASSDGLFATCVCAAGTALSSVSGACETCSVLCNGCTSPADNAACVDCAAIENMEKTGTSSPYVCTCRSPTVYLYSLCVYTAGCHPLCAGTCTRQGDSSTCVGSCNPTSVSTLISGSIYACTCAPGTLYNGTDCQQILYENCDPLCGSGCVETNNGDRCVDCISQRNVVSTIENGYFANCSCAAGTELVLGKVCAYTTGCSKYCSVGCYIQNNASACVDCVSGITPAHPADLNATCECPSETPVYSAGSCVAIVASNCSSLCCSACTSPADPTKCYLGCSNATHVVVTGTSGDTVSCGCENGTHLNARSECVLDVSCGPLCDSCSDSDTCLECDAIISGTVLSNGKCVCRVSEGYVLVHGDDGTYSCVLKASSTSTAMKYSGFVKWMAKTG